MLQNSNRYETQGYIMLNALILLFIAQFDKRYLGDNSAMYTIPILILAMVAGNYLKKSTFIFILLIFIGSHFNFIPEFGGTFTIVAIFILIYGFLTKTRISEIKFTDYIMAFLFLILVSFTILGWIEKSKLETRKLIFSVIAFFSLVSMFFVSSKVKWTERRIGLFISLLCIIMIYALFTAIANSKKFMPFNSTLWYSITLLNDERGSFFVSMLHRPTTAVGAMYFAFLFPFYLLNFNRNIIPVSKRLLFWGLISTTLVCVVGFSKSHIVVFSFSVILIPYLLSRYYHIDASVFMKFIRIIFLALIMFYVLQPFFHFDNYIGRFAEQPDLLKNFFENPLKAKNTTREESYQMGQESLQRENWNVGYGYANGWDNRIAWMGDKSTKIGKLDFHNTFYSLPQLFGWTGSIAYVLIFLVTISRMFKVFRDKRIISSFRILSFSFFWLFVVHIFTEYTITALSSPFYMMMLFILLGLANALFYNYKKGMINHPVKPNPIAQDTSTAFYY